MHLVSLWLYSGFHKLVSAGYYEMMQRAAVAAIDAGYRSRRELLAVAVAGRFGNAAGVLALLPRTRRLAAIVALPLHGGIIGTLYVLDWNWAVWPWKRCLGTGRLRLVMVVA